MLMPVYRDELKLQICPGAPTMLMTSAIAGLLFASVLKGRGKV